MSKNWVRPSIRRIGLSNNSGCYKISVIFDSPDLSHSKLVFDTKEAQSESQTEVIETIPPYSKALFLLDDVPEGSKVNYAIAGTSNHENLPSKESLLTEARYQFHTLPAGGPKRVGLATCNGIHKVPDDKKMTVWKDLLEKKIGNQNDDMDLLILAGDQIYADSIKEDYKHGEIDDSDVLPKYRKRYFNVWKHKPIEKVLAQIPSLMMWDDHDIYNGYGSTDLLKESDSLRQVFFDAAEQTFDEFQASGNPNPEDPFDLTTSKAFSFETNSTAIICADGRSNRNFFKGKILGDRQLQQLKKKIESLTPDPDSDEDLDEYPEHVFLVVGIPFLFVGRQFLGKELSERDLLGKTSFESDVRDGWRFEQNREEFRDLITFLFERFDNADKPRLSILSGDVHLATLGYIGDKDEDHEFGQITSSPIAYPPLSDNGEAIWEEFADDKFDLLEEDDITGRFVSFTSEDGKIDQEKILAKRNYATVDTTVNADEDLPVQYRYEQFLYEHEKSDIQRMEEDRPTTDFSTKDSFVSPIKDNIGEINEKI